VSLGEQQRAGNAIVIEPESAPEIVLEPDISAEKEYELLASQGFLSLVWIVPDRLTDRATYEQAIEDITGNQPSAHVIFWSGPRSDAPRSIPITSAQSNARVAEYTRGQAGSSGLTLFDAANASADASTEIERPLDESLVAKPSIPEEPEVHEAAETAQTETPSPQDKSDASLELSSPPKSVATHATEADKPTVVVPKSRHPMRKWTSKAGTTIDAELVSAGGGKVRLKTTSGKTLVVAMEQLSTADVEFIRGLRRKKSP